MGDLMTEAQDELATYPAPGPWVKRRWGTLGRSWQHRVRATTNEIRGEVASQGQIAPYNIYVQGPRQKPYHRAHGWRTPKDVLSKLWPKWVQKVRNAVKEAAG